MTATFETLPFFRGMAMKYPTDRPFIKELRTDRRPKDSSQTFHDVADEWFFKHFGVRYRSQVVCVTSRRLTAQAYAATPEHLMRIIPLAEYRYCWSPRVTDLLFKAKELGEANPLAVHEFLDSAGYKESGLEEASGPGNEVMLHCSRYLAIPVGLLEGGNSEAPSGIILPFAT